jgi:hypothetical protein
VGTLKDHLARFDEDYAFLRQFTVPEEDRAKYTFGPVSTEPMV